MSEPKFSKRVHTLQLMSIALLAPATISGLTSQMGLLAEPIAEAFGMSVSETVARFSWLTGGTIAGTVVAFFIFDHVRLKYVLLGVQAVLAINLLLLNWVNSFVLLFIVFGIVGIMCGLSTCAASTIVSKYWTGRRRESILVSQDAAFNVMGFMIPYVAVYFLTRGASWSMSVSLVALLPMVILIVGSLTRLDFANAVDRIADDQKTEWNAGIFVAGVALMFVVTAKFTLVLWLPQYVQTTFDVGVAEAGKVVSNMFLSGVVGAIGASVLLVKVRVEHFIVAAISVGFVATLFLPSVTSFEGVARLALVFGVAVAALFHAFMAYGLTFVERVTHKHVSYILFSGLAAGIVAPVVSSEIVERHGIIGTLYFASTLYGTVLVLLLINRILKGLSRRRLR